MEPLPTPGQPETSSGTAGDSIEALEQQLIRARAELAEYQAMLDELPAIYETKFRHQLQVLAQEIRRLMDERRALQEQLSGVLPAGDGDVVAALPPAATEPAGVPRAPRRPRLLRLQRWRRVLLTRWATTRAAAKRFGSRFSARFAPVRLSRPGLLALLALGIVVSVALLVVAVDLGLRSLRSPAPSVRSSTPMPAKPPAKVQAADQLLLRARGESWVQVAKLDGEVLYTNTLQAGDLEQIPLGDGLKVRSGRPDLLDVAVGKGPYNVLNPISNIDWRTFFPPKSS